MRLAIFGPLTIMILFGIPIAFTLAILGFTGLAINFGWDMALSQLQSVGYGSMCSYAMAVIPMFLLMGNLVALAGISTDLYDAAVKWLGNLKGGLAISTTFAATLFAAATGSTMASVALFTKVAFPEMSRYGYNKSLSTGCIAAAGVLAAVIPPSIVIVLYGIILTVPIGKVLIAGIIPGIITSVIFMLGIYILVSFYPSMAPRIAGGTSWNARIRSTPALLPVIALFTLVIGGMYLGWFTPSQAGAVGAVGALILAVIRRKLTVRTLWAAIRETAMFTSVVLTILIGGTLFGTYLSMSGTLDMLVESLSTWAVPGWVILAGITLVYLLLGCVMDPVTIMIVFLPPLFPLVIKAGYDPIWFGIYTVKMCEFAVLTPPVGLNVYTLKAAAGPSVTLEEAFKGVGFFLGLEVISLIILIAFPQIATFLPNTMM